MLLCQELEAIVGYNDLDLQGHTLSSIIKDALTMNVKGEVGVTLPTTYINR